MKIKGYTQTLQMKYGEADVLGRVRPATLMRCVEHVSLKHAEILGVSHDFTQKHHMVFLLAKQAIEFKRMPLANETLTFVTMPEQAARITFRRVTTIYDASGEEVACVDSAWVLMDTDTHKILRHSPVAFDENWPPKIERSVKMDLPKAKQQIERGTITAGYSQCDTNGHINNANYFDIVCDSLPVALLREKQVKRMVINYHREILLGQEIVLHTGDIAEDGIYISGNKDNTVMFEAVCFFQSI